MIWGYLHRWRTQRRLASALDMVEPMSEAQGRALDGLSTKEQARLLEQLVAGMETRDPYLHGHSRRVARHSWMIARRMGLPRAEVARIRTAAAVHDVGKIRTPMAILHKAGPLTKEEYEIVKRHPGDGAQMAQILRDPALTSIVRHHHERLDGSGYPDGLTGDEIPLGARIIAVADTFDAITSERPYRPAGPHKKAIDILKDEAGTRLDPAVVRAFCGHYAGRAPIALWSSITGLPERVVSWLGGSLASVASAAKVVAVAALVGGAAVTSSTLGLPAAEHHPTKTHLPATTGSPAQHPGSTQVNLSVMPSPAAKPGLRHSLRVRRPVVTRAVHGGSPAGSAGAPPPGPAAVSGAPSPGAGPAGEAATVGGGSEGAKGKSEGSPSKVTTETPSKGEPESPSKVKSESPSTGNSEEAHGKRRSPRQERRSQRQERRSARQQRRSQRQERRSARQERRSAC